MDDFWARNLQTAKLGVTEFPLARLSRTGGRRTARHRYPYRDGQDVEDMGRTPLAWDMVVPLFRGMEPIEPNTPLYPEVYDSLRFELDDPDSKAETEFVDPELGPIAVKVVSHVWDMVSEKRNGGVFRIQLEERSDDPFVVSMGMLGDPELESRQEGQVLDAQLPFDQSFLLDIWAAAGVRAEFSFGSADLMVSMVDDFYDVLDAGAPGVDAVAAQVDIARQRMQLIVTQPSMHAPEMAFVYHAAITLTDRLTQAGSRVLADAPRLVEFVTPWEMSSWEIAVILYGNRERGGEISSTNPTQNPLFYPRSTTLRVLDR